MLKAKSPNIASIKYRGRTYTVFGYYPTKRQAESWAKGMREKGLFPFHRTRAVVVDFGEDAKKARRYGVFIARGRKT